MKTTFAAIALAMAAIGSANAAVITITTGYSKAGVQADAAGYRDAVEAGIASHTYGSTVLSDFSVVSNQSLFNAGGSDIGFKTEINFGVSSAGTYSFRAGVDFEYGGAVYLDGQAISVKQNNMWWAGSYVNTLSTFELSNQSLLAGNHTLTIYGLESCCDGGMQVQYAAADGNFKNFSAQSLAPVPEPETYAMLLGGLGVVGAIARRRRNKAAAV